METLYQASEYYLRFVNTIFNFKNMVQTIILRIPPENKKRYGTENICKVSHTPNVCP